MNTPTNKIKLAIVGLGHWGPNLVRIFSQDSRVELKMLCDLNQERLETLAQHYPLIERTPHFEEVLFEDLDAVVLSTPTSSHYALAKRCLENGLHVLVEKPLAQTSVQCLELIQIAKQKKLKLMVGHVFLYNPAIDYIRELIQKGDLGDIVYAYSTRVNLGPVRTDVNALWDLAPHDISIFNSWFGSPLSGSARGLEHLSSNLEDVVFASLRYPNNLLVNLHVSWLDPRKIRQIVLVGTKCMALFDDLDPMGPVHLYDKKVKKKDNVGPLADSIQDYKVIIQEGDLVLPKIRRAEPLRDECTAFIDWIVKENEPTSTGREGLEVVRVLESLSLSLEGGGLETPVERPQTFRNDVARPTLDI